MTTHCKALTYEPKIPCVLCERITQTIRKVGKRRIREGDILLLHGWSGKPYRSPWSWRKKVVVKEVLRIKTFTNFFYIYTDASISETKIKIYWNSEKADWLAEMDGVLADGKGSGMALRALFISMYEDINGKDFEVIRWFKTERR